MNSVFRSIRKRVISELNVFDRWRELFDAMFGVIEDSGIPFVPIIGHNNFPMQWSLDNYRDWVIKSHNIGFWSVPWTDSVVVLAVMDSCDFGEINLIAESPSLQIVKDDIDAPEFDLDGNITKWNPLEKTIRGTEDVTVFMIFDTDSSLSTAEDYVSKGMLKTWTYNGVDLRNVVNNVNEPDMMLPEATAEMYENNSGLFDPNNPAFSWQRLMKEFTRAGIPPMKYSIVPRSMDVDAGYLYMNSESNYVDEDFHESLGSIGGIPYTVGYINGYKDIMFNSRFYWVLVAGYGGYDKGIITMNREIPSGSTATTTSVIWIRTRFPRINSTTYPMGNDVIIHLYRTIGTGDTISTNGDWTDENIVYRDKMDAILKDSIPAWMTYRIVQVLDFA